MHDFSSRNMHDFSAGDDIRSGPTTDHCPCCGTSKCQPLSRAMTPDRRRHLIATCSNTVCVWDTESDTCLATLEGHTDLVWSVSVTPNGRYFMTASYDSTIRVWDAETYACIQLFSSAVLPPSARIRPYTTLLATLLYDHKRRAAGAAIREGTVPFRASVNKRKNIITKCVSYWKSTLKFFHRRGVS